MHVQLRLLLPSQMVMLEHMQRLLNDFHGPPSARAAAKAQRLWSSATSLAEE